MPNPLIVGLGTSVGGSVVSGIAQKSAAKKAANAQTAAANAQIEEQRRQFNLVRQLAQPYVDAGGKSLSGVMNLIGMNGRGQQRNAIAGIEQGQEMAALTQAGEAGILSNASATGGLRGGNTEMALGQFRPQILSSLIDKQIGRLSGLASNGQNAALGVGTAGQNMANGVSAAFGQIGQAQAGSALASGQATTNMISGITGGIGNLMGGIQPPVGAGIFTKWGF